MANCKFPNCSRHAEKNGYCVGHRIFAPKSGDQSGKKDDAKPNTTGGTKKKSSAG
jgi:hypothetical protein